MLQIKQMCGYLSHLFSGLIVSQSCVWSEVKGSPHRRSTLDARCHWLQSGSSPSPAPHSLSTWERRGGRSRCNNTASHPSLENLGAGRGSSELRVQVGFLLWRKTNALTSSFEQASAVCTEEVLRVPGLVQRCQDVLISQNHYIMILVRLRISKVCVQPRNVDREPHKVNQRRGCITFW